MVSVVLGKPIVGIDEALHAERAMRPTCAPWARPVLSSARCVCARSASKLPGARNASAYASEAMPRFTLTTMAFTWARSKVPRFHRGNGVVLLGATPCRGSQTRS
jgi:hypothetical protein